LGGETGDHTARVAGNSWPQPGRNPSSADQVRPLHAKGVLQDRALDAESLQYGGHDFHVAGIGALHLDVTAGDGSDNGPASGFNVVASKAMCSTAKPGTAFHANGRRTASRHVGAKLREKFAELHHVRFASRMANLRQPGSR